MNHQWNTVDGLLKIHQLVQLHSFKTRPCPCARGKLRESTKRRMLQMILRYFLSLLHQCQGSLALLFLAHDKLCEVVALVRQFRSLPMSAGLQSTRRSDDGCCRFLSRSPGCFCRAGKLTCILGPSGSGKTTLLNVRCLRA